MTKNVVFTKYSSGQLQRRCKKGDKEIHDREDADCEC